MIFFSAETIEGFIKYYPQSYPVYCPKSFSFIWLKCPATFFKLFFETSSDNNYSCFVNKCTLHNVGVMKFYSVGGTSKCLFSYITRRQLVKILSFHMIFSKEFLFKLVTFNLDEVCFLLFHNLNVDVDTIMQTEKIWQFQVKLWPKKSASLEILTSTCFLHYYNNNNSVKNDFWFYYLMRCKRICWNFILLPIQWYFIITSYSCINSTFIF